ncbi:MAG TPA: GNAT family N-acetyltransferase [Smithellaceae bacterium]|nr:GNAT family N-acetyltransferase [Smithellaceae bacterium]
MKEGNLSRYESWFMLKDGRKVFLRPVLPTDEYLILDLFNKLHLDAIYMRFLTHLKTLPEDLLFQLTHIDYNKNFALVALNREDGKESAIAVSRYGHDPENDVTDLAVTVREDWQRNGLGKALLSKIMSIGREHGISRFVSMLDPMNDVIKHILRETGYKVKYTHKDGNTLVDISVEKS